MPDWAGKFIDTTSRFPASGEVRSYDLSVRLERGMSRHPAHPPYSFALTKTHEQFPYPNGIGSVSEMITMSGHAGTHVDALGHISNCGELHGGASIAGASDISAGLSVGAVEEVPPLIGPGHLLDGPALLGRDLSPEDGIGRAELERWFEGRPSPGPGSIVLIRTGWMARFWDDIDAYIGLETGLPGLTLDGAEWLSERGILAAGSDTMNLERKKVGVTCLDVHVHFLVDKGIYIIEELSLDALAADGITEFDFLAAALRIGGGSGSPLRPLAVVPREAEATR
jgi:kynurenine formamidase